MGELVSVVIPTYDRCNSILKAVNSVLQQTYQDIEIWVIDDAGADETGSLLQSMNDNRIHYIKLKENLGAGGARNEGVHRANGKYIAFQDSDDIWKPEKLEKQMAYLLANPNFSMVYCGIQFQTRSGEIKKMPFDGMPGALEGDLFRDLLIRNSIGTPGILAKKNALMDIGGFDSSLRCIEDWEMVVRFSKKYQIGYIDEVLVEAGYSEGSVSSNVSGYYMTRCKMIVDCYPELIKYELFDLIVEDVLEHAARNGCMQQVKQLLMALLAQRGKG